MSEIFLSLVGTQILGTLQPWLAFFTTYGAAPAYLLPTGKTAKVAQRLADYAQKHGMGETAILPVPDALDAHGNAPQLAADIASKAASQKRRVCFNLDGGLNYMIAASALALQPFQPLLIQAGTSRVLIYDTRDESCSILPMPQPLPPLEILNLQAVPHTISSLSTPLIEECARENIGMPANALKNVTIGGIEFDLVWTGADNRLNFLVDCRFCETDDAKVCLAKARDLAQWATDRSRGGQLYDRKIFALTNLRKHEGHIREESGGKVIVVNIGADNPQKPDFKSQIEQWLGRRPPAQANNLTAPQQNDSRPLEDAALVTCVGTNLASTIAAICAHRPKRLVLCHTGKNDLVGKHARRIVSHARDLGIEFAELATLSIEGLYTDLSLPQAATGVRVQVNISPGAKGQGAMLALWAKKNGFSVWSLDNRGNAVPIFNPHEEKPLPTQLCDPALYFRLCGWEPLEDGVPAEELQKDPMLNDLLDFMRKALKSEDARLLMLKNLVIGNDYLKKANGKWKLGNNCRIHEIKLDKGLWFEHLAAVALTNAGARHVRARLRLPWAGNAYRRPDSEGQIPHRLDLDVVGVIDGNFVLISCKSNPYDSLPMQAAATEAQNTGQNLGRFCLRLLADMRAPKARLYNDKVMIIGWRELCQPEVLRELLRELAQTQTTVRV